MADLVADISEAEQRTIQAQKESSQNQHHSAAPLEVADFRGAASIACGANAAETSVSPYVDDLPPPPADPMLDLPLPPPPPEPLSQVSVWGQDGRTCGLCSPSSLTFSQVRVTPEALRY